LGINAVKEDFFLSRVRHEFPRLPPPSVDLGVPLDSPDGNSRLIFIVNGCASNCVGKADVINSVGEIMLISFLTYGKYFGKFMIVNT
jgi:hypothetical protein